MKRLGPRSLFGQLLIAQCLVFALIAVCVPILLSHLLAGVADDFVAGRLRSDAVRLSSSVLQDSAGWHLPRASTIGPYRDDEASSRAFLLVDAHGNVLARSGGAFAINAISALPAAQERFLHHGAVDMLVIPLSGPERGLSAIVAQNRDHPDVILDNVVSTFISELAWIVPLATLLSLLFSALLMRRVTRIIETVSQEADAIRPDRLDVRLSTARLPLEVKPLARAANLALDRVEAGYQAQAEFVANVAHELRTPLASIALRAEAAPPDLRAQLSEAIERASHVVSQLMELAFVENAHPGLEPVDLCKVTSDVIEAQAPMVFRSGRSIEFEEPDSPASKISGSPGLIGIALTNLIDNAIRHTPPGTHVIVGVQGCGVVYVSDDGPGIASDAGALAPVRYWRADTTRSDSAGIGLAIVTRIMAVLGGTFALSQGQNGGALATLSFKEASL